MPASTRHRRAALFVLAAASGLALAACGPAPAPHAEATAAADRQATPAIRRQQATPWPLPATAGRQPDLATAPDGTVLLSWIDGSGDAQRLRFARWANGRWTAPLDVVAGEGIGNAADTPHVRQTPDRALWATWLRRAGGGHASDVVIARSGDDGRTWSAPVAVNTDGTPTEHGFASVWVADASRVGVAWLDGRATRNAAHGASTLHNATMLRAAVFDAGLGRSAEAAIDTTTCDCCQTDVTVLDDGARVVYRDRAPGEIRDIGIASFADGRWGTPVRVHEDRWHMPGCPVNGPAVAGAGRMVVVAWYTMRGDAPTVRFARSTDGGATFGRAVDLASSPDVLGRVDVALDATGAWVTWLDESARGQVLRAAHVAHDAAGAGPVVDVATLDGRGRGTGWPRLASTGREVRLVWTDVADGAPVLRGAVLPAR